MTTSTGYWDAIQICIGQSIKAWKIKCFFTWGIVNIRRRKKVYYQTLHHKCVAVILLVITVWPERHSNHNTRCSFWGLLYCSGTKHLKYAVCSPLTSILHKDSLYISNIYVMWNKSTWDVFVLSSKYLTQLRESSVKDLCHSSMFGKHHISIRDLLTNFFCLA